MQTAPSKLERAAWVVLLASAFMQWHGGFDLIHPGHELHVLVNEKVDRQYTPGQAEAVASAKTGKIHEWLDQNCTVVDGTPERRVWDSTTDTTGESSFWQAANKHDHGNLPSVEISRDGKKWGTPKHFDSTDQLQAILNAKRGTEDDVTSQ